MSETTTAVNDWDPIWTQQAEDEYVRSVIKSSAALIESFLVSDDQTEEETLALLGRRLSGEIDTTTYDVVLDALRALLGQDGANVVHWYTVGNGAETGILEQVASPRVAFFVRRIAAAHLPEFKSAFALWKEVPEDWRTIHLRTGEEDYLDKLTIGVSFSIPGIADTSNVKDYQHFVPSGEAKRTTTDGFFQGLAQHVTALVKGPVVEGPAEPVIVSATIGPAMGSYGSLTATAVFDDGSTAEVVSWYDDEISFTESELIGLTQKRVIRLFHDKDIAYIKS